MTNVPRPTVASPSSPRHRTIDPRAREDVITRQLWRLRLQHCGAEQGEEHQQWLQLVRSVIKMKRWHGLIPKAFSALDLDGSGTVELSELYAALQ